MDTIADLTRPPYRAENPIIPTVQLVTGTLLAKDLARSRRFYEDILGLECVSCGPGRLLARSRRSRSPTDSRWILDIRQADSIPNPQRLLHHWGIDLVSKVAVDKMNQRLKALQAEYGIGTIHEPQFQHGVYAFYFSDLDSNWWEFQFLPEHRLTKIFETGDALLSPPSPSTPSTK